MARVVEEEEEGPVAQVGPRAVRAPLGLRGSGSGPPLPGSGPGGGGEGGGGAA